MGEASMRKWTRRALNERWTAPYGQRDPLRWAALHLRLRHRRLREHMRGVRREPSPRERWETNTATERGLSDAWRRRG